VNNSISSIETTGQQNSYTFSAAGSQTLQLLSITDHMCTDTTTRLTYVNYNPSPQFSVDKPNGCPLPHCVKFTDNSSPVPLPAHIANWAWDFGDGKTASTLINADQNNCYINSSSSQLTLYTVSLTTTTDSGCVASIIKPNFITVYPKPIANYTIVPEFGNIIVPLVHFINESVDYTNWWWSFGDGPKIDSVNINPDHYYPGNDTISYNSILIVANQYGCKDTANMLVEIAPDFSFYIPNAFSPNGDNTNDVFMGIGEGIATYEMWVFDRWGVSVFYTNDIKKGWDGKVQGKSAEVKQDVYVWKVRLKDVLGKKHIYIGHVTLLK
jgi:gliding motility-associated-like protein